MKLNDLVKELSGIDAMAAIVLQEAMTAAAGADGGLMLPETVIFIMSSNIAQWRRKAIGDRAAAEGRLTSLKTEE